MPNVYNLNCSDGTLYVGQTRDHPQRLRKHNAGKASRHTRTRRPVQLAYAENHATRTQATRRERQLKGWSQAKKAALIEGDLDRLKQLSVRRRTE